MKRVFIDGSAGTTGLRIRERLSTRADIELVVLSEETRKNPSARHDALNSSDISFLCLPDAAAVEAVAMVENPAAVIIDTSTAHRTSEGWEYGFPELDGRRERIASARRIANPGCHASGFIALVEPLVRAGIISRDALLCASSLTGFSGGGKKMIADYEANLESYMGGRQYALGQTHKHLPEMAKVCGLANPPVFSPIVVPHYSGMEVTVQLHGADIAAIAECYRAAYADERLVKFVEDPPVGGFLSSTDLSGRDGMEISVHGDHASGRAVLVSRFDNLGKGASGAAIQNMNIAIGCDEMCGLCA